MKPCKYCGEAILDAARKCRYCQSFQDSADAPRTSNEPASLFISFVGLIATIGAIAGAFFGYMGFQAIGNFNDRVQKFNEQSAALFQNVEQKIKTFETKVAALNSTVNTLEEQATNVRSDLNSVAVSRHFERFVQTLDQIQLDYAYNFPAQILELTTIANASNALRPLSSASVRHVSDMQVLAQAAGEYRDALKDNDKDRFISVIVLVDAASDDSLFKNRILAGTYGRLANIARNAGNAGEAATYDARHKHHALAAYRAAERSHRPATIAKVNYANTLVQSGDKNEMTKGYELLLEARKDAPQVAGIWYNIAVYFTKIGRFDEALTHLEQAKNFGDFATCADLKAWTTDSDFRTLRETHEQNLKDRIEKLTRVASGPC
ncbi:MAG: hypothetical protein ACK4UO_09045 [Pseudolabrys sp.]